MAIARGRNHKVGGQIGEMIRLGFGGAIGTFLALMIFIAVGALLFIPGYYLVNTEERKKKEERTGWLKMVGYVLMILGMIVGLGFGAGAFFGTMMTDMAS